MIQPRAKSGQNLDMANVTKHFHAEAKDIASVNAKKRSNQEIIITLSKNIEKGCYNKQNHRH